MFEKCSRYCRIIKSAGNTFLRFFARSDAYTAPHASKQMKVDSCRAQQTGTPFVYPSLYYTLGCCARP
ncbi:hypothetical protein [Murimonas intestini]|uniref:hypothetical protein n=1 Tax=Murimonas intestini TaxID=1337051 RepID=UPI000D6BD0C2|nr:hypothetical protein [Murimonas intestini]MCR1840948.1 hypothetical protein [Murimonas intestini]